MWHHPKYYKELRKRNNGHGRANLNGPRVAGARSLPASDQAISDEASTEATSVRPGPGPKRQASSNKLKEPHATSDKHQAPSSKHQA